MEHDLPSAPGRDGSGLFGWIAMRIFALITFVTITLPATLYSIFSMTFTFTLNFTTLLVLLSIFGCAIAWLVRYRLLTVYARLPQEYQRVEPRIPIIPPSLTQSKARFSSYLEDLFSEIFGYLEPIVFQDLTGQCQTRRLMAGETLLLEHDTGFCLVVDGEVQILTKRGSNEDDTEEEDSDEDYITDQDSTELRYQLISEVKNGAPLSSLFSILSLFFNDDGGHTRKGHRSDPPHPRSPTSHTHFEARMGPAYLRKDGSVRSFETTQRLQASDHLPVLAEASPRTNLQGPLPTSSSPDRTRTHRRQTSIPPLAFDTPDGPSGFHQSPANPNVIARAVTDTTIAIIPASSFRRLTRTHPKAAAHIIHVILTRFNRATLGTSQRYLGLVNEVSQLEKEMNDFASVSLPSFLQDDPLSRLKDRFSSEREKLPLGENTRGIALHNPRTAHRRLPKNGLGRDLAIKRTQHSLYRSNVQADAAEGKWSVVSPGDLVGGTHTKLPAFGAAIVPPGVRANQSSPVLSDSEEEENEFRHAIMGAICQALGISNDTTQRHPKTAGAPSIDAFPFPAKHNIEPLGGRDPKYEGDIDSTESVAPSAAPSSTIVHTINDRLIDRLLDDVEILFFPRGSVLVEQGERTPGLYYVIDGFLEVGVSGRANLGGFSNLRDLRRSNANLCTHLIKPGGLAGYLGSVSNHRSLSNVTAKSDVFVGFLSRAATEHLVEGHPAVLFTLAKRLTALLPRTILHVDFALEWTQKSAGSIVFEQGTESDAIYIVLNGRLRAIREKEGQKEKDQDTVVIDEYAQGDSIGELEVLTGDVRPASLHAIRDSELVRLPKTLFEYLAAVHPEVSLNISRTIARRMQRLINDTATRTPNLPTLNLRTIAIIPASTGVPIGDFATRLTAALIRIGTPNGVASLSQTTVLEHLGRHVFSRLGALKLPQYLADLEEKFGLVLYVADSPPQSLWTRTCINKADCILLVARADSPPRIGEYERLLFAAPSTVKELVLLHDGSRPCPQGLTRRWLRDRPWITGMHHHIHTTLAVGESTPRDRKLGDALRKRVQGLQTSISRYTAKRVGSRLAVNLMSQVAPPEAETEPSPEAMSVQVQAPLYSDTSHKNDFLRLARHLRGKSIGLVLGGGGARGIAHVGILRAFDEAGIPIDVIGGTSIGAFIGALYSADADVLSTFGKAKKFAARMNSVWRFLLDLTYPSAAYTTGHEFNRSIFKTFGDAQIEDFRLPFYCNSTNISNSRHEIHDSGYVWRYVRASMSLAGLIPPLCDEGRMLLDGGYVDNLTVEHMSRLGASVIFAVDVGSLDDQTPQEYGDSLSGLWTIFNRWNPFSSTPNPPSLSDIQSRLAYVSSVDALERAKNMPGCHYLRPEIDPFGTLEFGRFEEIEAVGYQFGKRFVEELRHKGEVPGVLEEKGKWPLRRTAGRRASI